MSAYFGVGMGLAYLSSWPMGLAEPGNVSILRAALMGVLNGVLMYALLIFLTPKLPRWMRGHDEEAILDEIATLEELERSDKSNR
jgi:hypothetical protein